MRTTTSVSLFLVAGLLGACAAKVDPGVGRASAPVDEEPLVCAADEELVDDPQWVEVCTENPSGGDDAGGSDLTTSAFNRSAGTLTTMGGRGGLFDCIWELFFKKKCVKKADVDPPPKNPKDPDNSSGGGDLCGAGSDDECKGHPFRSPCLQTISGGGTDPDGNPNAGIFRWGVCVNFAPGKDCVCSGASL
jgi:hypothetical protein